MSSEKQKVSCVSSRAKNPRTTRKAAPATDYARDACSFDETLEYETMMELLEIAFLCTQKRVGGTERWGRMGSSRISPFASLFLRCLHQWDNLYL
jgi:hypothetical protein